MERSFVQKSLRYAAVVALAIILLFLLSGAHPNFSGEKGAVAVEQKGLSTLTASSTTIAVMIAETPEEREHGLSGRTTLDADMGMLFVFDHPDRYGFWMPNMLFPLDIIWIDANWRIVDIAPGVTPASYPLVFKPKSEAQYVLEVNAGNAAAWGWGVGTGFAFTK